jgi:hypothetical protein
LGWRDSIKNNIPKVELHSIMSLVAGGWKTGKTRLWKEVTELHYSNPEEVLLLAFEAGYETWKINNFIDIHNKAKNETELWKVWEFFKKEVVPGLIEEASIKRIVKLLGIDTADKCIDAAGAWIMKEKGKKYGKTFSSLQEISDNTPENGWILLQEELSRQFDTLRNAGYGIMAIAWTKEKETTLYNGKKYNSVELMMSMTGRKVFESQAHFICCLYNEVNILDKEGTILEDNIKDKKGKEKGTNFHETETYMYFRPSQYISIAGGRYKVLPEKIPYSAENYLKVFENAVLGQLDEVDKPIEELKIEEEKSKNEKNEITENIVIDEEDTTETKELLKEQINKIVIVITALQKDGVKNKVIKEACNNNNPKNLTSIEEAKKVFENLSKLAS